MAGSRQGSTIASDPARDRLRKDAAENRTKLLAAARRVFAAQGTDAPLESVAAEAGVGIATLYRRFPAREDLLALVVEDELEHYVDAIERALTFEDPSEGFTSFLEGMCELQASQPGLCHAPYLHLPNAARVEALREQLQTLTERLIANAKATGSLRPDVTLSDVMLLASANAGIIANAPSDEPGALRRHLELMLRALRLR